MSSNTATVSDLTKKFADMDIMIAPSASQSPRYLPTSPKGQKKSPPRLTLDHFVNQAVKEYIKSEASAYLLDSHESAEDLDRLRNFYLSCKAKISIKMQKLDVNKTRSSDEEKRFSTYRKNCETVISALQSLEPLKERRSLSRANLIEKNSEVRKLIEERKVLHDATAEVHAFLAELNSQSPERLEFLRQRLIDLNRLIQGIPSRNTNVRTSIVDGIKDLWRTAAATSMMDRGIQVLKVHEHAHNPDIATDPQDTNIRFRNIFERFLRHSGDLHQAPETSHWNMQANEAWANSTASKEGLEVDTELAQQLTQKVSALHKQTTNQMIWKDVEKAITEKPDDQELLLRHIANLTRGQPGEYNILMERYLRSCAQPMYTGTLSASDLIERAKKLETVALGFVSLGRDFDRSFLEDGLHRIMLNLRCFMRLRNKETNELPYATFTVSYTLILDAQMNGIQLTSRAYDLVVNSHIK